MVFVDYQNLYMATRRRFCRGGPPTEGQVPPGALARVLADRTRPGPRRRLAQVRVYRGAPSADRDPKGHGASLRQATAWRADPLVEVITRPLRYPRDFPRSRAQEKGIDVRLAVDFVEMAIRRQYDVGVLVSQDTDLLPALEAVTRLGGGPTCEVAAWQGPGAAPGLRVAGARVWCHHLTSADYAAVADSRDYTRP